MAGRGGGTALPLEISTDIRIRCSMFFSISIERHLHSESLMKPVFQALTSIVVFDFAPECADIEFFILINYFDGIFAKTVSVRHGWFGIFDAHVTNVTHLSAFATIL